jgi:hypothetical protein
MKKMSITTGTPCRFLYILALFSGILLFSAPLAAQVHEPELANLGSVEFINYVGPYSRIETHAQIHNIGYELGQLIRTGAAQAGSLGRYQVINSRSEPDGLRLDADIIVLGVDVAVDHIRNLRLIVQGYLEAAYGYNERDAALLAQYITIYNAVYRGDMNFFDARYKRAVLGHLNEQRVGLSLRYDEWPGRTLIVVPLGGGLGGPLSNSDTGAISDSRVTDVLRQEDDLGLDQRRDMIDFLEREAEDAGQIAALQRESIREEEERIRAEREAAQQQLSDARQQEQQAMQEQQQIAQERLDPGADQAALDQREEAADERIAEARQQQDDQQRADADPRKPRQLEAHGRFAPGR